MADTAAEPIPIRVEQGVSGERGAEAEAGAGAEADVVAEVGRVMGIEEGDNCVVCFEPTTEKSTQLFLYNCRCVYFIHEACFRQWRQQTGTYRVCLICREGLESFENEEGDGEREGEAAPLLRARVIGPRLAEIPIRALYHPVAQAQAQAQAQAPNWFWAIDTEQKMLLMAVACFLLVLLFHLRHSRVVVYTYDETLLLAA
jgi:hypothetical protein